MESEAEEMKARLHGADRTILYEVSNWLYSLGVVAPGSIMLPAEQQQQQQLTHAGPAGGAEEQAEGVIEPTETNGDVAGGEGAEAGEEESGGVSVEP